MDYKEYGNNLARRICIPCISFYQHTISPDHGVFKGVLGRVCRFEPTCSEYAKDAIEQYGIMGIFFTIKRLAKCHPFHEGGYDPVISKEV